MANFRQNHQRRDRTGFGRLLTRVALFGIILCVGFVYLYQFLGDINFENAEENVLPNTEDRAFIPKGSSGEIVHHDYYSLSYIEDWEIAEWVAYPLTASSLRKKNVPRSKRFNQDPLVSTGSAKHGDYSHSGYSRGHMAPAGDMAFNTRAMKESFYMSNMAPQLIPFNGGIWRELEESVRDWAEDKGGLFIVSGPIMDKNYKTIGYNKIAVPKAFYKVMINSLTNQGIGFIMPNEVSERSILDYAVSIDEVEAATGLDFFANMLDLQEQEFVESQKNITQWPESKQRFKQRVNSWNKR